jgi:hypothetical protein
MRFKKYQMGGSMDWYNPNNDLLNIDKKGSRLNIDLNPTLYNTPETKPLSIDPQGSTKLSSTYLSNPGATFSNNMNGTVGGGTTPTGGGKFGSFMSGVGKNAGSILPYVSNLVNSFRKIPKPLKPELELPAQASLVNYDADRVDMDRQFLGMIKGMEAAASNPGAVNANRVAALGKFLEGKSRVSQLERNTNAQIQNRNNELNTSISARNTERGNNYKESLIAREIAQQQHNAQNLANFSDKVQMQRRDKSLMDLEKEKLQIIPRVYGDTGVVDRNILDLLKTQIEKQGGSKRYGGHIKRYFNRI